MSSVNGRKRGSSCLKSGLLSLVTALSLLTAPTPATSASQAVRQFDPASGKWVKRNVAIKPRPLRSNTSPIVPAIVPFSESLSTGTIVVDTEAKRLYRVLGNGAAVRYGVGVGREGFTWRGKEKISRKAEWPSWVPPQEMIEREAANGRILPDRMDGGPDNPLGARALYLGSTLFRIHGTNQPWSIGQAVSSGCIRMANDDIIELFKHVQIGTQVIVR
jgi:lipoprotein-anchoring transpeptidase ErfK/SrfK